MSAVQVAMPVGIPPELSDIKGVSRGPAIPKLTQSRIALSSLPGRGKSTLVHSSPKIAVLDVDNGGISVKSPRAIRFGPVRQPDGSVFSPSTSDYRKFVDKLISLRKSGKCPVEMIAIDTLSSWFRLHAREVLAEKKASSLSECNSKTYNPYDDISGFLWRLLDDAYDAGLGWCVLCHLKEKSVTEGKNTVILHGLDLWPSVVSQVWASSEHMLGVDTASIPVTVSKTVGTKTIDIPSGYRDAWVVECKPGGMRSIPGRMVDLKTRVPLPDRIEISQDNGWSDLEAAYDAAVATLTTPNKE